MVMDIEWAKDGIDNKIYIVQVCSSRLLARTAVYSTLCRLVQRQCILSETGPRSSAIASRTGSTRCS
jgi:predicted transcriptional regulator